ncbi:hypothetical protein HWV62_10631 [Athelia sp. TMB]|nr:hypothetical protein HWV62_10631 [Athelia sp. TMB]
MNVPNSSKCGGQFQISPEDSSFISLEAQPEDEDGDAVLEELCFFRRICVVQDCTLNVSSPDHLADAAPAAHAEFPRISIERDTSSLTSAANTEDDRTTWAGSQRHLHGRSVDDMNYHGSPSSLSLNENHQRPRDDMAWMFGSEYASEDVAYNSEGHLVGGTLDALVTRLTPHDSIVNAAFSAVFFLTFRLFASPSDFVDALVARYHTVPPLDALEHEQREWQRRKGIPIRMRVTNVIKQWVEIYWRPSVDDDVIPFLTSFVGDTLTPQAIYPRLCTKILEGLAARESGEDIVNLKGHRVRDPGMSINPPSPALVFDSPRPVVTKTLLVALRSKTFGSIHVTDFDPLELARQLTIMENQLYMAITPQELLETGPEGATSPPIIQNIFSLNQSIACWVAESILNEPDMKKRTAVVKFFIKVADGLPRKNHTELDELRRIADDNRNYHEYRSRLRKTAPPGVPLLELHLTDVIICRERDPSHRPSPSNPDKELLNFNKYVKLARIVPYKLKKIPEVQEYLSASFENSKHHGDWQNLFRRSMLVEPIQLVDTAQGPYATDMRQLFSWAIRPQGQFLPLSAPG